MYQAAELVLGFCCVALLCTKALGSGVVHFIL